MYDLCIKELVDLAKRVSDHTRNICRCNGGECDTCSSIVLCKETCCSIVRTADLCAAVINDLVLRLEIINEQSKLIHAHWVLEYPDYDDKRDDQQVYVCSNCHMEAGWGCDPDGFVTDQDLTRYCGHCHAVMDECCK